MQLIGSVGESEMVNRSSMGRYYVYIFFNLHALLCLPAIFYIADHQVMLYNVTRLLMGHDSVLICEDVHALPCMFTFYMNIIIIF